MTEFKAIIKKWRNSLGFKIPNEVVNCEKIKLNKEITVVIIGDKEE